MPKKYRVKLSQVEHDHLDELTSRGSIKVRTYKRAQVLLLADENQTGGRYVQEGLEAALYEKPRSGAPKTFKGKQAAQITALACSEPPPGYGRWSLRLLADKMVELEHVDHISYGTVKRVLKKMNLSLT